MYAQGSVENKKKENLAETAELSSPSPLLSLLFCLSVSHGPVNFHGSACLCPLYLAFFVVLENQTQALMFLPSSLVTTPLPFKDKVSLYSLGTLYVD